MRWTILTPFPQLFCRQRINQKDSGQNAPGNVNERAEQFLLAEYQLLRETRAHSLALVQGQVNVILTLQTAEVAFVGILVSSKSARAPVIAAVALLLGLPTMIFTYNTWLSVLNQQIFNRRYLRAINTIRGYFISQYPHIDPAVKAPTNPLHPPIPGPRQVVFSFSGMVLILALMLQTILTSLATWLLLYLVSSLAPIGRLWVAGGTGIASGLLGSLGSARYIKERIKEEVMHPNDAYRATP